MLVDKNIGKFVRNVVEGVGDPALQPVVEKEELPPKSDGKTDNVLPYAIIIAIILIGIALCFILGRYMASTEEEKPKKLLKTGKVTPESGLDEKTQIEMKNKEIFKNLNFTPGKWGAAGGYMVSPRGVPRLVNPALVIAK